MNTTRAVLLIVFLLSFSMIGIVAGVLYLYKEKPQYLGLKARIPKVVVTTATMQVDTTAIRLVNERQMKKAAIAEKDSLANILVSTMDSLNAVQLQNDSLRSLAEELRRELEAERMTRFAQGDSLTKEDFQTFAKIYNSTDPQVVARVLENIDVREASFILRAMSKRSAARVVEALPPEQAAGILTLGSAPEVF